MKRIILIVILSIIGFFIVMAIIGYNLEKNEIKEISPDFESKFKEAKLVYEKDSLKGIEALEEVMFYGHSHSLKAYDDFLVTGYNESYREGLNILAKYYLKEGKKLLDEGKHEEVLEVYSKIYNYTAKGEEDIAYKKGSDVDILIIEIQKLSKEIR